MYPTSQSSSSRGPSFDYSRGPSLDASSSVASDPFVDRSLYDPSLSSRSTSSSNNSRSSSRVRTNPTTDQPTGRNPWSPLSSEHGGSPPPESDPTRTPRPGLPTSTSDLSRQISAALSEDLPPPSSSSTSPVQNGRKRSESGATLKASKSTGKPPSSSSSSFMSQFRTGSGWFAPMVEQEAPLSREEYAAKEKERIEKLKNGSKSARRPGLMKRFSSGLELSGFGSSPSKR
ncbi:uncharacterized protein JCM15063_006405 [Sporobolomyces koalae]|uniref:uncharacterized protein n=1 Tax=Sporobolomyces koalae TaxID=500713 RepID=UPI00316AF31D